MLSGSADGRGELVVILRLFFDFRVSWISLALLAIGLCFMVDFMLY